VAAAETAPGAGWLLAMTSAQMRATTRWTKAQRMLASIVGAPKRIRPTEPATASLSRERESDDDGSGGLVRARRGRQMAGPA
jgi:hypothetical protein